MAFVYVEGTNGHPYSFGDGSDRLLVEVPSFFIGTVTVTQSLWDHVVGAEANTAIRRGPELPMENISWEEITRPGGFLDQMNESPVRSAMLTQLPTCNGSFRLPSETEWEYAARGGPHWRDGLRYSGSDAIERVGWYDRRHGDQTQPVARKAPNELGIYDMSGNVWEWCQDVFTSDVTGLPQDGTAFVGPGPERSLRGGCFHNWAVHCTVWKRYAMEAVYHDGCIGCRLVFPAPAGVRGA